MAHTQIYKQRSGRWLAMCNECPWYDTSPFWVYALFMALFHTTHCREDRGDSGA